MQKRALSKEYFFTQTTLHPPFCGSLEPHQKRLRSEFNTDRIYYRYDWETDQMQVWEQTRDGRFYCILGLDPPWGCGHVLKAISILKGRQKTRRQLAAMWQEYVEEKDKARDTEHYELARETRGAVHDHAVGKVTTSARSI
ncbi:MAG: hypothetical protein ACXADY_23805 [Candidatus Hodarchaeales archaeon]|jgi:hypothetical protein